MSKSAAFWKTLFIVIIASGLAGGVFIYLQKAEIIGFKKSAVIDIIPTPTSEPEEVDLSKYKIKVLNGSGVVGEASKAKELIESEEFVVSETGNADRYDYTETIIKAKKGVPKTFLDQLKETLADSYVVSDSVDSTPIKSGSTNEADVLVIVGSTKK